MVHVKNGRPIEPILVTAQEKPELKRLTSAPTVAKKDSERAEIILLRAQGMKQEEVASQLQFREGGKVDLALSSPPYAPFTTGSLCGHGFSSRPSIRIPC
jgi:hypothetical protein